MVVTQADAASRLREMSPPLVVHAPATLRRLGMRQGLAFDLLELFAFVLPAQTVAPTPRGLAIGLDLDPPAGGLEAEAALLPVVARALLNRLAQGRDTVLNRDAPALAARMGKAGWGWAPYILAALNKPDAIASVEPFKVWKNLPEWEDAPAEPPPAEVERVVDEVDPEEQIEPPQRREQVNMTRVMV